MTTKERISSIFVTIVLTVFCLIPLFDFKTYAKEEPKTLYRVYLNGKSIGIIESKDKLEEYINQEQKELKEEYGVSKVYLPKGLYISEYVTYNANITKEEDIYDFIKQTENFTIKGYTVNIKKDESNIVLNVLNKDDFTNSVTNVVKSFIPEDELQSYLDGEDITLVGEGSKIENLYLKESLDDGITIKESYIPSNEKIFIDEKSITKYLLFGDNETENKYKVKEGDTIASIAENNKLAVEEFLVVNPDIKSEKTLLSIGQEVSVALISPIITVVEEEHLVEAQTIKYDTTIKYDNSLTYGVTRIDQDGQDGKEIVTQKIKYENGKITEAIITGSVIETEAINKIKIIGTKGTTTIDPSQIPSSGDWAWPTLRPFIISSYYAWRWGSFHEGVDITGTGYGSPILAANNGIVYKVFYDSTGGYQIWIAHSNNIYTMYAHLSKQLVSAGQTVTRGQKIGLMGSTGVSTGTHLHFGTYVGIPYNGGKHFNPLTLYR